MTVTPDDGPDDDTRTRLRSLSEHYAQAADRGDADLFVSVFHPDARLQVHNPTDTDAPSIRAGHDDLGRIPGQLARYSATFHMLGQSTYTLSASGEATGEVYCMAHHLSRKTSDEQSTAVATDYVMFIRYNDEYRRDADGQWRIALRRVLVDWTETRPAT